MGITGQYFILVDVVFVIFRIGKCCCPIGSDRKKIIIKTLSKRSVSYSVTRFSTSGSLKMKRLSGMAKVSKINRVQFSKNKNKSCSFFLHLNKKQIVQIYISDTAKFNS